MVPTTIKVDSWLELQEALYHDSWNDQINRFRSPYVYRGMHDISFRLSSTLNRLGETHLERHLIRNFKKYSVQQLPQGEKSIWHWLALANHHGLPTRLLDWTYSPLVALHFCTESIAHHHKDAIIWAINYPDTKKYLPPKLASVIEEEGSHIFTADMLDAAISDLSGLRQLREEAFPVFFEPPSNNERIVNQYAVFSLMSDPDALIDDWVIDKEVKCFKIIIPASLKWEVRDKLDQANINERVLFPGLDGLALWLKRHYINSDYQF